MALRASHTSMNATTRASTVLPTTQTLPPQGLGMPLGAYPFTPTPGGSPFSGNTGHFSPFAGAASPGSATAAWGITTHPSFHQAPTAPLAYGAEPLSCPRREDVVQRIDGILAGSGFICATIRTDGDDKICLGRALRLTRAKTDALPLEAGGTASRQDMPNVTGEILSMFEKRPTGLDSVRGMLFPTSVDPCAAETGGDETSTPPPGGSGSADHDKAGRRAPLGGAVPYLQHAPSDAQIAETISHLQADSGFLCRTVSSWPLTTRITRRLAGCPLSSPGLLLQLHPTIVAAGARTQRVLDDAARALVHLAAQSPRSTPAARNLHAILTNPAVLDSETAQAIEDGELIADLTHGRRASPWHRLGPRHRGVLRPQVPHRFRRARG